MRKKNVDKMYTCMFKLYKVAVVKYLVKKSRGFFVKTIF